MKMASMIHMAAIAGVVATMPVEATETNANANARLIERGRYVVKLGGCNDCHTPEFAMKGGQVAEKEWLTGDSLGWRGPWGTTYPTNLRLYMAQLSEDQWVKAARTMNARPPMPWYVVRDMHERDLRALHRFVRSLGPAGQPAPAYVPPDQQPAGPVIAFPAPPK